MSVCSYFAATMHRNCQRKDWDVHKFTCRKPLKITTEPPNETKTTEEIHSSPEEPKSILLEHEKNISIAKESSFSPLAVNSSFSASTNMGEPSFSKILTEPESKAEIVFERHNERLSSLEETTQKITNDNDDQKVKEEKEKKEIDYGDDDDDRVEKTAKEIKKMPIAAVATSNLSDQ